MGKNYSLAPCASQCCVIARFGPSVASRLLVRFLEFQMNKNTFRLAAVPAILLASVGSAMADTVAFTGAVTSVTADIATYGGALVGVAAVGVGFMVGMKYVKKIRGAA
jgi:NhaP-type Na+/H+ and K+/H+ antiporter